jgi:methyl-accepting chemotaxis protein
MNRRASYKRRNYFVNQEFQGRMIFHYFILAAMGSILFLGVFSFFSSNTLSITYDNYQLQLGLTPGILFRRFLSTQWVFIVGGGVTVVAVTLFLTHRVAGPFFRFEKTLDAMVQKDLSDTILLRKKDEGKALATKLNTFNHLLARDLETLDTHSAAIGTASQTLQHLLDTDDMDSRRIQQLLNEIIDSRRQIQTVIDGYTFLKKTG